MFAHRGARAYAPENTIEAFELGLRLGATGLESDVWVTADDVAVLDHDGVVGRRPWRRQITAVERDRLPDHIPSIDELFRVCGTGYDLSLDLNDVRATSPVIEAASAASPDMIGRLWLCHTDLDALVAVRQTNEQVRLIHSTRLARLPDGVEMEAARLRELGIDGINLHHSEWTGGYVTLLHRFERVAFAWDLQFDHLLRPVLRMGVDAVYSDHVDVMLDAYRAELGEPGNR